MDWNSDFIAAVSAKALDFTLSISFFDFSASFKNSLDMCLAKRMH